MALENEISLGAGISAREFWDHAANAIGIGAVVVLFAYLVKVGIDKLTNQND